MEFTFGRQYKNTWDVFKTDPMQNNQKLQKIIFDVDFEDKYAEVETVYDDHTTPMAVHHGLIWRFTLPTLTDILIFQDETYPEEIKPIIDDLLDKFDTKWDGHNWVGGFNGMSDEEADYKYNLIYDICQDTPILDDGGLYDMGEYFINGIDDLPDMWREMTIEEIADEMLTEAKENNIIFSGHDSDIIQLEHHFSRMVEDWVDEINDNDIPNPEASYKDITAMCKIIGLDEKLFLN